MSVTARERVVYEAAVARLARRREVLEAECKKKADAWTANPTEAAWEAWGKAIELSLATENAEHHLKDILKEEVVRA